MKTAAKTRQIETPYKGAKRILLGAAVDPTLSAETLREYVELHDEAARRGDEHTCDRWRTALMDKRRARVTWDVVDEGGDLIHELPDAMTVAVLMDIRDALGDLAKTIRESGTKPGKRGAP